jgi:hypothetical protein
VVLGAGLVPFVARGTTAATVGLPLYAYVQTTSGPLPWDATAVTAVSAPVVGTPTVVTTNAGPAFLTRSANGDVLLGDPVNGSLNLMTQLDSAPAAAGDPVGTVRADGSWSVLWTTATGHLIWANSLDTSSLPNFDGADLPATTWVWRDLSADGVLAVGTPALSGTNVVTRSPAGTLVWWQLGGLAATPTTTNISALTAVTAATDPQIVMTNGSSSPMIVTTTATGHVVVLTNRSNWSVVDATVASASAPFATGLSLAVGPTSDVVAGLTASGDAQLVNLVLSGAVLRVSAVDATRSATNATPATRTPILTGRPALVVSPTGAVAVAAAAANWGDLITLRASSFTGPYTITDVSATGGSAAHTVGGGVAGAWTSAGVTWYAGGVATPAPTGTGLYAAPSPKWATAITDGWPIMAVTGGLGTQSSPWVQTTNNLSASSDFQLGTTIAASHHRVTWLSFWTVSGPLHAEVTGVAPTSLYYAHAFQAGQAVATQIDKYRGAGLGLKPDWVVIDPEGYPDLHSCMDGTAPGASWCASAAPTTWAAYVNGWAAGLASVDATLKPGVYASQSEIKNGALGTLSVPLFVATAFTPGHATALTAATPVGATSLTLTLPAGLGYCDPGLVGGERLLMGSGNGAQLLTVASGDQPESMLLTLSQPTTVDLPPGTAMSAAGLPPLHVVTDAPIGARQLLLSQPHDVCNTGAPRGTVLTGGGVTATVASAPTLYLGLPLSAPTTTAWNAGTIVRGFPGPPRYATTTGANLLGYIAFLSSAGDTCASASFMRNYFTSATWGGLFNTIQFNPGTYCVPQ